MKMEGLIRTRSIGGEKGDGFSIYLPKYRIDMLTLLIKIDVIWVRLFSSSRESSDRLGQE